MFNKLKRELIINLKNIPGWSTRRKIIVFESDDWGSLRMPGKPQLLQLIKDGLVEPDDDYDSIECMESAQDMEALFNVLRSVKDANGRHAVFTPFVNLVNPDFAKIKASGFKEWHQEVFTETLTRLGETNTLDYYKEGIDHKLFVPEYHGREHLNVYAWLQALQAGNPKVLKGFEQEFSSVYLDRNDQLLGGFRQTYFFQSPAELEFLKASLIDGAHIFERVFGYKASVFDAPNAIFHPELERVLPALGIKNVVLQRFRLEPDGQGGAQKGSYQFGQRSTDGMRYHIRNCMFEPRSFAKEDLCLKMIAAAFRWNKPAIITTHRVNYIGGLRPEVRRNSLMSLSKLLKAIVKQWPDAEFMTSAEFACLMHQL